MTLDELIGARLAVGFPGTEATPELIAHLRAIHAQSLVVFARNFHSPEQFRRLIQRLTEGVGTPLLVMVDHEGGRVVRFSNGVTPFPDAMTQGRTQAPEAIERQGTVEAQELRGLGVGVNLAPCVDVFVDGSDPVIGDRSYGTDSDLVGRLSAARIRGLQSHGVMACAKHFPGLGAVQRDPHKTLPTITLDWTAMETTHLPPFRAAIASDAAMVMSSHVCYPTLGDPPGWPATFSARLGRQLLRQRLRFEGLLLTDDLEMGALQSFGTMGEAAVRATEAGHDLLLICSDLTAQKEAFASLQAAYQDGRLPLRVLELSVERLARSRKRFLV
ncbi:MAG: beta-N-acetylhexosaminidase [Candidatus Omnitrophica bacterium]|nr:beta-N-acetylhexosaminidase [Candidatus Omnitrophota bacterium]